MRALGLLNSRSRPKGHGTHRSDLSSKGGEME